MFGGFLHLNPMLQIQPGPKLGNRHQECQQVRQSLHNKFRLALSGRPGDIAVPGFKDDVSVMDLVNVIPAIVKINFHEARSFLLK